MLPPIFFTGEMPAAHWLEAEPERELRCTTPSKDCKA